MVSRSNLKTFFNYATDYINFFKIKFTLALVLARKRLYKKPWILMILKTVENFRFWWFQ